MRIIIPILLALSLAGCFSGGNVYPPHPDWAKDAWERQGEGGN